MIFKGLYEWTMRCAAHRHAERYLAGVSIIESIFFPVPTALMVAPMAVARPERAVRIALIATVTSVFGGLFGYALGYYAIAAVEPIIESAGYWDKYMTAQEWFNHWGFWAVVVAGFSHFFLVSLSMAWAGPKLEPVVRKYIEWLGWATVAALAVYILVKMNQG